MAAVCVSALRVFASAPTPTKPATVKTGQKFADVGAAVSSGLVQGCAPFPDGIDAFGFFKGIEETQAQRYADGASTHSR
jgi:hypothetical protein